MTGNDFTPRHEFNPQITLEALSYFENGSFRSLAWT